jgi:hypothetical protein
MRKLFFAFLIFVFSQISNQLFAQEINMKFGKVSEAELLQKQCKSDTSALAEVLFDKGYSYFVFDNTIKDFRLTFERHIRIKVYKKEGIENTIFNILLYKNGTSREELQSIKGVTYNLVAGKIEKTKLEKKEVYYNEADIHNDKASFSLPNVVVGSVIELEYTLLSDFYFNFQNWQIQRTIPVQYSEYYTVIPEFYRYQSRLTGHDMLKVETEESTKAETFSIKYESTPGAGGVREGGMFNLNSNSIVRKWVVRNIPAFIPEEYITSRKNYMSYIVFELLYYQFPGQSMHSYTDSWENITDKLLNSMDFGKAIDPSFKVKETAEETIAGAITEDEKITKIYNYVTQNIIWNEYVTCFSDNNLSIILKDKKGNSADINLLLISMLQSVGIDAVPAVLSTRENGMLNNAYPTITQLNYVLAYVNYKGKRVLLDGTEKYLPIGFLPMRCMNGTARIISTKLSGELNIEPAGDDNISEFQTLTISATGDISGAVAEKHSKFAGFKLRNAIENEGGIPHFIKKVSENTTHSEITEMKIEDFDDISKAISLKYNISQSSENVSSDLIIIDPMKGSRFEQNPFKLAERRYPVDFGYPITKTVVKQLTRPAGYDVSELPANTSFALPEGGGKFQFVVSNNNGVIQISSKFEIKKTVFQFDNYKALKNFYDMVIAKQAEKIVLKKKV